MRTMNDFKERFKLTRPKNIDGETAMYYFFLRDLAYGATYTTEWVRICSGKSMTFQALREKGLIKNVKGKVEITEAGQFYVKYVESTNKPVKDVLRAIMGV